MGDKSKLAFGKKNYILHIVGIVIIGIGFFIMSIDKETYGFGFLGLTLGPVVVMSGFIIEIFSIFSKDKGK